MNSFDRKELLGSVLKSGVLLFFGVVPSLSKKLCAFQREEGFLIDLPTPPLNSSPVTHWCYDGHVDNQVTKTPDAQVGLDSSDSCRQPFAPFARTV